MRVIIGITCGTNASSGILTENSIDKDYIVAIEEAGGTPIIIPNTKINECLDDTIGVIDGLILSGGVDIDPYYFSEESKPALGRIDPERDRIELYLANKALDMDMPIFGICRGIQLLNVAVGGTLYQDINTEVKNVLKHRQSAPEWYGTQAIDIAKGSRLLEMLRQPTLRVNSFHHQAVKDIAEGFIISAIAHDGIIEGIEGINHRFAIGVQFHPESMWQNCPPITALFKAFVTAAISYRQMK